MRHIKNMKKILPLLILVFLVTGMASSHAQQKFTISGHIKDAGNGEDIIGATVSVAELPGLGAAANLYGFYSLTLPQGKYNIVFYSIGFSKVTREVDLQADLTLNIGLPPSSLELQTVEISSEKSDANVKNIEMSVNKLDIKAIQKIPALLVLSVVPSRPTSKKPALPLKNQLFGFSQNSTVAARMLPGKG